MRWLSLLLVAVLGEVLGVVGAVPLELQAGVCPPRVARRVCTPTCKQDQDCPNDLICCATDCGGLVCSRAFTASAATRGTQHGGAGKQGQCPAVESLDWVCSSRCRDDFDCGGTSKCCRNRCGAMGCTPPGAPGNSASGTEERVFRK